MRRKLSKGLLRCGIDKTPRRRRPLMGARAFTPIATALSAAGLGQLILFRPFDRRQRAGERALEHLAVVEEVAAEPHGVERQGVRLVDPLAGGLDGVAQPVHLLGGAEAGEVHEAVAVEPLAQPGVGRGPGAAEPEPEVVAAVSSTRPSSEPR